MSSKRKMGLTPKEIRTSPEPEHEDEAFTGRNGETREDGEDGIWSYTSMKKSTPPQRDLASPVQDETSSSGQKEDEDDEEEDSDDMKALPHDPERLKAFNMFVRLFVDENLDRMVPISKQPKEKIQAIIDSCTRQFPEFAERARKRIRTYLKSCRRNKRTREQAWPQETQHNARPTPAHLTSVQAEQILAQACENESHNAKRMRLGLEPVSQPMPLIPGCEGGRSGDPFTGAALGDVKMTNTNSLSSGALNKADYTKPADTHTKTVSSSVSVSSCSHNGTPLFRPGLSMFHPSQGFPASPFPATPFPPAAILPNGGATDLSMKGGCKPVVEHKLSGGEVAAVRQLITGYRESAAFLLRSADELEQLLLHQP